MDSSFIEFKLDYSKSKSLAAGEAVKAHDLIVAGGHIWRVSCYSSGLREHPSGDDDATSDLSLFASRARKSKDYTVVKHAIMEAFVVGADGAPLAPRRMKHVAYDAPGESTADTTKSRSRLIRVGWSRFARRSKVESEYAVDGCVRFICGIIMIPPRDHDHIPVPAPDLGTDLGNLLMASGDGFDVAFLVGGVVIHAHRAVLAARSPAFRAQLLGSWKADDDDDDDGILRVKVDDMQPLTFKFLLVFVYTDELLPDELLETSTTTTTMVEFFQNLLAAADMFHLTRLKLVCDQKLWERVTVENVAAMLGCAEMSDCPELKKKCIDFFVAEKNFKSAVLTDGYMRLMESFPSVIDEIRARV